jgi:hypothetical protein
MAHPINVEKLVFMKYPYAYGTKKSWDEYLDKYNSVSIKDWNIFELLTECREKRERL